MVVPEALKAIRMRADRNFCVLGQLSKEVGWGYTDLVEKLEGARKLKEQAYYQEKKEAKIRRDAAAGKAQVPASASAVLQSAGF